MDREVGKGAGTGSQDSVCGEAFAGREDRSEFPNAVTASQYPPSLRNKAALEGEETTMPKNRKDRLVATQELMEVDDDKAPSTTSDIKRGKAKPIPREISCLRTNLRTDMTLINDGSGRRQRRQDSSSNQVCADGATEVLILQCDKKSHAGLPVTQGKAIASKVKQSSISIQSQTGLKRSSAASVHYEERKAKKAVVVPATALRSGSTSRGGEDRKEIQVSRLRSMSSRSHSQSPKSQGKLVDEVAQNKSETSKDKDSRVDAHLWTDNAGRISEAKVKDSPVGSPTKSENFATGGKDVNVITCRFVFQAKDAASRKTRNESGISRAVSSVGYRDECAYHIPRKPRFNSAAIEELRKHKVDARRPPSTSILDSSCIGPGDSNRLLQPIAGCHLRTDVRGDDRIASEATAFSSETTARAGRAVTPDPKITVSASDTSWSTSHAVSYSFEGLLASVNDDTDSENHRRHDDYFPPCLIFVLRPLRGVDYNDATGMVAPNPGTREEPAPGTRFASCVETNFAFGQSSFVGDLGVTRDGMQAFTERFLKSDGEADDDGKRGNPDTATPSGDGKYKPEGAFAEFSPLLETPVRWGTRIHNTLGSGVKDDFLRS